MDTQQIIGMFSMNNYPNKSKKLDISIPEKDLLLRAKNRRIAYYKDRLVIIKGLLAERKREASPYKNCNEKITRIINKTSGLD